MMLRIISIIINITIALFGSYNTNNLTIEKIWSTSKYRDPIPVYSFSNLSVISYYSNNRFYADVLDNNGVSVWSKSLDTDINKDKVFNSNSINFHSNYAIGYGKQLSCYNLFDGKKVWSYSSSTNLLKPFIFSNNVYYTENVRVKKPIVYYRSLDNGDLLGSFTIEDAFVSPQMGKDLSYVICINTKHLLFYCSGRIQCYSFSSKKVEWSIEAYSINGAYSDKSVYLSDEYFIFSRHSNGSNTCKSSRSSILCLDATSGRVIASFDGSDNFVVTDGCLYFYNEYNCEGYNNISIFDIKNNIYINKKNLEIIKPFIAYENTVYDYAVFFDHHYIPKLKIIALNYKSDQIYNFFIDINIISLKVTNNRLLIAYKNSESLSSSYTIACYGFENKATQSQTDLIFIILRFIFRKLTLQP